MLQIDPVYFVTTYNYDLWNTLTYIGIYTHIHVSGITHVICYYRARVAIPETYFRIRRRAWEIRENSKMYLNKFRTYLNVFNDEIIMSTVYIDRIPT